MGLLPLLTERIPQAQVLIPLATSLVFELITSTVLVLIVIPAVYVILGDFGIIAAGQNLTRTSRNPKRSITKARNKAKKIFVFSDFRVFVIKISFHKMQRIHN